VLSTAPSPIAALLIYGAVMQAAWCY